MEELDEWEEPVQSVQELAEKQGVKEVPAMYIRPLKDRPESFEGEEAGADGADGDAIASSSMRGAVPVIDYRGLLDERRRACVLQELAVACEEWGVFHLLNHSIAPSLLHRVRQVAAAFFDLPLEEKKAYANTPSSLIGYGSRMGVAKDNILDWSDYFVHYVWPLEDRAVDEIWPAQPSQYRATMDEYSREIHKLYKVLMAALSSNLGLRPSYLRRAFGKGASHILRMNYYPPCPQPHLTLGLGSHSDAGGLTFLLQDQSLGLQVKKGNRWITLKPIENALLINIADQLQILSNGKYKSVEHRAIVNDHKSRTTIAIFCNPADDTIISPVPSLLDEIHPPLYRPMTYGEFLTSFFKKGLDGKGYVESFKTQNHHLQH